MLAPQENAMAVFSRQHPDYYGDFMPTLQFAMDPITLRDRIARDSKIRQDSWGTSRCYLLDSLGSPFNC